MPRRSNLFQQLTFLIHKALSPEWEVAESEMLIDSITGQRREVDIVAKRNVMGYWMVLSVECQDRSRPADVTWVESMAKKHEHLPTSKLVLWSRSGFTQKAMLKTKALKIDAVSQARVSIPLWARLAHELVGSEVLHVAPSYKPFVDIAMPDGSLKRFDDVENWRFFDARGVEVGSFFALIGFISLGETTRNVLLDNAPLGLGEFWVQFIPPEPWFADIPDGERCRANRIGVGIQTTAERAKVAIASAAEGGSVISLASAAVQLGKLEFLIEENEDGNRKVISRLVPKKSARSGSPPQ
jgi:hypothetical protein